MWSVMDRMRNAKNTPIKKGQRDFVSQFDIWIGTTTESGSKTHFCWPLRPDIKLADEIF